MKREIKMKEKISHIRMENITQIVCTIYGYLLILDFMNANKWTTAAVRHWIVEGTAALIKTIYFRAALVSGWRFRMKNILHWRRGCASIFTVNKKLDFFKIN